MFIHVMICLIKYKGWGICNKCWCWLMLIMGLPYMLLPILTVLVLKHIPKEIKSSIGSRNLLTNIFRVKAYNSVICGYFCIGFTDHILAGKTLIDNTSLFLSHKNDKIILSNVKNWWTAGMYPDLSDQTQFKLNKINKIKDYFITKSWERETTSKGLSKYIAALNYINQPLSIDKGVSIASFVCVVVALVE